ncbi:MAG: hypothetical protein E6J00_01650 [Chloroflexi bacterium]|nr:MAG: hypothetical protein E6J00_01650 [Chloroflexota bacterium]
MKIRRYHGMRTRTASSRLKPQRRQKWRVPSLTSPQSPQKTSPSCGLRLGACRRTTGGRRRAAASGARERGSSAAPGGRERGSSWAGRPGWASGAWTGA